MSPSDADLFDDDLHEQLQLAEVETRCVSIAVAYGRVLEDYDVEMDAETFVFVELIRQAEERGVPPATVLSYFQESGFVARAVEAIERGLR